MCVCVCVCVCLCACARSWVWIRLIQYWWRKDLLCYNFWQSSLHYCVHCMQVLNHSLGTDLNQSKILPTISAHFSCPSSHHMAEVGMKTFLMLVCTSFPSYIGISEVSFIILLLCSYFNVAQICCSASFILCQCCNFLRWERRKREIHKHMQFQELILFLHY